MTKTRRASKHKTKGKNKNVIWESVCLTQTNQVREFVSRRTLKKKEKEGRRPRSHRRRRAGRKWIPRRRCSSSRAREGLTTLHMLPLDSLQMTVHWIYGWLLSPYHSVVHMLKRHRLDYPGDFVVTRRGKKTFFKVSLQEALLCYSARI